MEQRRADTIAEALEERIFDGTYSDGDRLDEVRLAEQFGVSRTPFREALQPGPVELIEMFEAMAEIEAVCGRLAAMRISDEALAALQDANVKCEAAVDCQNPDGYYTENERFHRIIYEQSGNSYLTTEANELHRRLKPFRRQQLRLRGRMAQSMAEHKAILDALEAGDPVAAAETLRGHVAIQGEKFHSLMATLKRVTEV